MKKSAIFRRNFRDGETADDRRRTAGRDVRRRTTDGRAGQQTTDDSRQVPGLRAQGSRDVRRRTTDIRSRDSGLKGLGSRISDLSFKGLRTRVQPVRYQDSGLRSQVPSMTPDVGHRCICSLILVIPFDKKQILYLKSAFHTLQYNEFTDTILFQFHHGPQLQQNLEKAA